MVKTSWMGWGCDSVVQHTLISMVKAVGSIPGTKNKQKNPQNILAVYLPKIRKGIPKSHSTLESLLPPHRLLFLFLRFRVSRLSALWPNGNRCQSSEEQGPSLWSSKNTENGQTFLDRDIFTWIWGLTSDSMNVKSCRKNCSCYSWNGLK